jgi:peroxiredoxin 5
MASAPVLQRLGLTASRARSFHISTRRAFVKVGDAIPSVELVEKSPGNKVNLKDEIKGRALIIGVPAAFSA